MVTNVRNESTEKEGVVRERARKIDSDRQYHRIQIKDLAARAGYHRVYVSEIFRGITESLPACDRLEKALNELVAERREAA